jgi:integrase
VARRGANEGTIRKRTDGRWEARVVVTDAGGRRVRRSLLGKSRSIVVEKLQSALRADASGLSVAPERLTLAAYLQSWLTAIQPRVRPRTLESYELIVRVHLTPGLGRHPLGRLLPQQVQAFLNAKTKAGFAPRTVAYIRAVLRQALGHAERWGLVSRNVARLAEPPRVPRREVRPFNPAQARQFLDVIRGDRYEALYLVALGVGLRQGELLGLSWDDVDLDAGNIRVRVFLSTVGTPLEGVAVTKRFQALLADAGLPRQRFHDLRHACASLLLMQGVAPRVVMETLGHSQISLTMNTYTHVVPGLTRDAANRMDGVLGARTDLERPVVA